MRCLRFGVAQPLHILLRNLAQRVVFADADCARPFGKLPCLCKAQSTRKRIAQRQAQKHQAPLRLPHRRNLRRGCDFFCFGASSTNVPSSKNCTG